MKKLTLILLVIIVSLSFTGCFGNNGQVGNPGNKNGQEKMNSKDALKHNKNISETLELPRGYDEEIKNGGHLEYLDYKMKMLDGTGRVINKNAVVYIPGGYSKDKKYNVIYWMHGWRGSQHTYLGWMTNPRPLKTLMDNMIANGDIEPMIVVAPTFTEEYKDYYVRIERMGDEVIRELIPAVEGKYFTYAKSTDKKGIAASRNHRAFGGFSMGGCTTWFMIKNHADAFKYFMPISMPMYYDDKGYVESQSKRSAYEINQGVGAYGYDNKDLYIYSASGGKDFMNEAIKGQVKDLSVYKSRFKYTDKGFDTGNITFHSYAGSRHNYKYTPPYIFNGLVRFFK